MTFVSYNSNTTSVTREAVITLPESMRVRLQFLEVFMVFNLILLCSTLWILVCLFVRFLWASFCLSFDLWLLITLLILSSNFSFDERCSLFVFWSVLLLLILKT